MAATAKEGNIRFNKCVRQGLGAEQLRGTAACPRPLNLPITPPLGIYLANHRENAVAFDLDTNVPKPTITAHTRHFSTNERVDQAVEHEFDHRLDGRIGRFVRDCEAIEIREH